MELADARVSKSIEPTPAAVRDAIARGDVAGAAQTLTGIIANDRRADWAFINLIALLANLGRRADALAVARRAIVGNPANAVAHEQLGSLLSVENDLPAGEWHFRRALEAGGTNAGPLANLALNLMQQGRTTESEAAFAEADRLAPKTLRILAHWSKLREVQGDFAGAERLLDAAQAASSAEAVNLLRVQYLARTGRDTEALAIIEAARNINGDGQLERGRLYERVGRHGRGLGRLRRRQAQTRGRAGRTFLRCGGRRRLLPRNARVLQRRDDGADAARAHTQ